MRIRILAVGVALVGAALLSPSAIPRLIANSCTFGSAGNASGGGLVAACDPGTPPPQGVGLLTAGSAIAIPTGTVRDAELADLNGDGRLDVILLIDSDSVTDGNGNVARQLVTMLGQGEGSFSAPVTIATPFIAPGFLPLPAPSRIAMADVNGDGRLDVIVPGQTSTALGFAVFLGNGDGTFGSPVTYDPYAALGNEFASSVAVGDLTGDGIPDVVLSGWRTDPSIVLDGGPEPTGDFIDTWAGDGHGGFSFSRSSPDGVPGRVSLNAFALGDVNGDGHLDAVTDERRAYAVLLNDGTGLPPLYSGDVFRGPGSVSGYAVMAQPGSTMLGDLNGDGLPDIVQFDGYQFYTAINGPGEFDPSNGAAAENAFVAVPSIQAGSTIAASALADMDGDGKLDAVGVVPDDGNGGHFVSVLFGDGTGGLTNPTFYPTTNVDEAVAVGDLNGDGSPDVVAAGEGSLTVLLGRSGAVAFEGFTARGNIERHELELHGRFTLGANSDGIDPATEPVTLTVGSFTASIPAGSFRLQTHRRARAGELVPDIWMLHARIDGSPTEATIVQTGVRTFEIDVEVHGTGLPGHDTPATVQLTIGNDQGSVTIGHGHDHGHGRH